MDPKSRGRPLLHGSGTRQRTKDEEPTRSRLNQRSRKKYQMQVDARTRTTTWIKGWCSWVRVPRTIERKKTLRQGTIGIGHQGQHSRTKTMNPEKDPDQGKRPATQDQ